MAKITINGDQFAVSFTFERLLKLEEKLGGDLFTKLQSFEEGSLSLSFIGTLVEAGIGQPLPSGSRFAELKEQLPVVMKQLVTDLGVDEQGGEGETGEGKP